MGIDIYTTIINEISSFEKGSVKVTDSYLFNQFETIKRIILYDASKFESGEYDSEGFKKFFFNISVWRNAIASKQIDFDTKDILAIADNPESYYATFFFMNELKYWIRTNRIGKLINEICWDLPKFGSIVIKRAKNKLEMVDLRNFKNDPAARSLNTARYINEVHLYSPYELYEMSDVWNKGAIKNVLKRYELRPNLNESDDIKVFERHGIVKECWLDKYSTEPNKLVKGYFIIADTNYIHEPVKGKVTESIEKYSVLHSDTYENLPYEEGHWMRLVGRWLGVGITELLFDAQVRENELVNLKAKGLWWTGKRIYQSRDSIISKNLLTDVTDGDILTVKSEITPVANEERNLSFFAQEERKWHDHETQSTFSQQIMRGETMPSATPLGSVYLQQQMAASFFDLKKEDIGMFFKDVIMNQVIPIFKEEKYEKHVLIMSGNSSEELTKFEEMVINHRHGNEIIEFILKNKKLPSLDQSGFIKSLIVSKIRGQKERYIELPDGFYEDLKYRFSLTITGEQINIQTKMSSLNVILQMLMSNPELLKDPFVKKTLFQMLNLAGIDPTNYATETSEGLPGEELIGMGLVPPAGVGPQIKTPEVKVPEMGEGSLGSPPRLRMPITTPAMAPEEKVI